MNFKIAAKILLIFLIAISALKYLWVAAYRKNPMNTKLLNAIEEVEHVVTVSAFFAGAIVILSL